jgi:predicted helicase
LDQLWKYYDIKEAYLWKYVPYSLLVESHIIIQDDNYTIKSKYKKKRQRNYNVLIDTGIDIICKLNNGNIILVQCKAYNNSVVSQKHLAGFYRTVMDSIMFNKINNKKYTITGLIAHTTSISDIITTSYCYKKEIIRDIYIPFEYDENKVSSVSVNKLKKYKDITLFINILFFLSNIIVFIMNYKK